MTCSVKKVSFCGVAHHCDLSSEVSQLLAVAHLCDLSSEASQLLGVAHHCDLSSESDGKSMYYPGCTTDMTFMTSFSLCVCLPLSIPLCFCAKMLHLFLVILSLSPSLRLNVKNRLPYRHSVPKPLSLA